MKQQSSNSFDTYNKTNKREKLQGKKKEIYYSFYDVTVFTATTNDTNR